MQAKPRNQDGIVRNSKQSPSGFIRDFISIFLDTMYLSIRMIWSFEKLRRMLFDLWFESHQAVFEKIWQNEFDRTMHASPTTERVPRFASANKSLTITNVHFLLALLNETDQACTGVLWNRIFHGCFGRPRYERKVRVLHMPDTYKRRGHTRILRASAHGHFKEVRLLEGPIPSRRPIFNFWAWLWIMSDAVPSNVSFNYKKCTRGIEFIHDLYCEF